MNFVSQMAFTNPKHHAVIMAEVYLFISDVQLMTRYLTEIVALVSSCLMLQFTRHKLACIFIPISIVKH